MINFKTEGTTFRAYLNNDEVCHCTISVEDNKWTITAWYTVHGYGNQGFGTKTMKYAIQQLYKKYGMPSCIEYVWNGANQYVYDWLEKHFDPISKCPLSVLKTQNDDEWDAHIYRLNIDKFLNYFLGE